MVQTIGDIVWTRTKGMVLIVCFLVPIFSLVSPGTGVAAEDPNTICFPCHDNSHVWAYNNSIHRKVQVDCIDCHDSVDGSHLERTKRTQPSLISRISNTEILHICGHCHADILKSFIQSKHHLIANEQFAEKVPVCTDCHSSIGNNILTGENLHNKCAECHNKTNRNSNKDIPDRAQKILFFLKKLAIAEFVLEEAADSDTILESQRAVFKQHLHRIKENFLEIGVEWHKFNLNQIEMKAKSEEAELQKIGEIGFFDTVATKPRPTLSGSPVSQSVAPLRFAVSAMVSSAKTSDSYEALFKYLARAMGRGYVMVQRRTYKEINDLLTEGKIDLAFICSGALAAYPDRNLLEILVAPNVKGKAKYHSYIVVSASSDITSFDQLKGRTFAFSDSNSNSGYIYPIFRLLEMGVKFKPFFSKTIFSGSHDNSILALYRKLVDGIAVDSLVYESLVTQNSRYWNKFRVIEVSPAFSSPPVVSPISVDPLIRGKLKQTLLGLSQSEVGKQLLSQIGADTFVEATAEDYLDIYSMVKKLELADKSLSGDQQ